MTSLSYESIFNSFLGYVDDVDMLSLDDNDILTMMTEYLHKASAKPTLRNLFSSLVFNDEIQRLDYEMEVATNEEQDKDFTIDILSKAMAVEWLQPQVKSKVNISQFFGEKEQKFYAQSNHISELRSMLEDMQVEIRHLIRDRGYLVNPYLGDQ